MICQSLSSSTSLSLFSPLAILPLAISPSISQLPIFQPHSVLDIGLHPEIQQMNKWVQENTTKKQITMEACYNNVKKVQVFAPGNMDHLKIPIPDRNTTNTKRIF